VELLDAASPVEGLQDAEVHQQRRGRARIVQSLPDGHAGGRQQRRAPATHPAPGAEGRPTMCTGWRQRRRVHGGVVRSAQM